MRDPLASAAVKVHRFGVYMATGSQPVDMLAGQVNVHMGRGALESRRHGKLRRPSRPLGLPESAVCSYGAWRSSTTS